MSSTPIIFNITDAGRLASVDQQNNGLNLRLKKIAFGTGHYDSTNHKTRTHLDQPIEEAFIAAGGVPPGTSNLILGVNFVPTHKVEASEVGIFTENGVLFAVASVPAGEFFTLNSQVAFVGSFGLAVGTTPNVTVEIQVDAPIVQQLIFNHETALNPHPQYATQNELSTHITQNTLEHNNILTLITAAAQNANLSVTQAVDYLTSLLQQHKSAANPHPQYLLASTFGVHMLMNASLNTIVDDAHRVYGWNGENGDTNIVDKSIRWWNTLDETATFKPYRAYGKFLLHMYFQPQGDGEIWVTTFNANGTIISSNKIVEIHDTHEWHDDISHVFELPKGGYAQIRYWMNVWNRNYGVVRGSIYVDDRVKRFMPVGYSSLVDEANFNQTVVQTDNSDYTVFPNFEWFYYSNSPGQYLQLSSVSSFDNPESKVPHYYRKNALALYNIDIYVIIELGSQSIENPSDYERLFLSHSQASVDRNGDVVIGIPFEMRNITLSDEKKAIFRLAYYVNPTTKTDTGIGMPAGSIDGEHIIYVNP